MKDTKLKHFEALTDIFLNSINRKNYPLLETLSRFYYDEFKKEREKYKNEPVVYPTSYYELVYKTIEELLIQPNRKNAAIEVRTAGSIWLLGEMSSHEISEQTYTWIWRNLLLAIRYQNNEFVIYHWQTAHQYITYNLGYIYPDYDHSTGKLIIKNAEQVEKRKKERKRFLEFHFALGGLLLYKQKYEVLNRMFRYTTSHPPKYELLPESMSEIFTFYNEIRDMYELRYPWISSKYPFPEQNGVESDYEIKKWISSYMALLFLRQYTIQAYLITMKPMDFPDIPKNQSEIKEWIDNVGFFKALVDEHLQNNKLLSIVGFDFISKGWCEEQNVPYPADFIETFKKMLEEAYKSNAETLLISDEKKSQFYKSTQEIIETTLTDFRVINNIEDFEGETDKWFVNGQRMLQSKDAFSENPEVHHIDFDSFLASIVSNNINEGIASTFLFKRTKTYLLKSEDIFQAIDNLKLTENHVIVGFGVNLDYYINYLKTPHLTKEMYRNNKLYLFNGARVVDTSFFILKTSDLPKLTTKSIKQDLITKYELDKISSEYNLYASVIDLNNTTNEILNENKQDKEIDELKKSVLLNIIMSLEILWRKKVTVIQLQQYTEYIQKGIPNKLDDIKKIE